MRSLSLAALLVCSLATAASAKPARHHVAAAHRGSSAPKRAPAPAPATTTTTVTTTETTASAAPADDATPAGDTKGATPTKIKTKTYTFGAMDVEGKLKTPQLLYFLNRVKLELDMSAPDKRSFMKELAQSADDKSL
jgi:hypothetical protein